MSQSGEPFDPYYQWLGIPPEEQPPNHYRLLGIRLFEENSEVIQNASDRQMVHLRTFQNGPRAAQSQKLLNEVAAAKLCLLSPDKRASYDAHLRVPQSEPAGPPPPSTGRAAVESPNTITWVTSPGTLPVGTSRRKTSTPRAHRRSWLVPLLLSVAAVAVAIVVARPLLDRRSASDGLLVLTWPAAERAAATLQIDGQPVDVEREAVQTSAVSLALALGPGLHRLQIQRPNFQTIDRTIELSSGAPTNMTVTFVAAQRTANLTLRWPASEREGAVLEINNQPYDWRSAALGSDAEEVRLAVDPGDYTLRIARDGATVFERTFSIKVGKRVLLQTVPTTGRLVLRWPATARAGASLDIDGVSVDLTEAAAAANPDTYEVSLRKGRHALRIVLASGETVERTVELVPGQRWELDVASATKPEPVRIVLQWLASEREGSLLEVDGQPRDLTDGSVRSDEQQVVIEVTPGEHAVRIVRPGYGDFQVRASGGATGSPIAVTWDRPATERPSAAEREQLRESFRASCEQLEEYRKWDAEKDEEKKQELLKYLLAKMELEAAKLSDQPAAQLAACDESIRLALTGGDFVQARKMLRGALGAALFSEAERQERDELIWRAALKSTRADPLIDFLKFCSSTGRLPTEQEESIVVDRLSTAPEIADDVAGLVGRVTELQDLKVLTPGAATKAQVAIYVAAAHGELGTPARVLDLSEKMLDAIPTVYESGLTDASQQVNALVDAVGFVCRKAFQEISADDALRFAHGANFGEDQAGSRLGVPIRPCPRLAAGDF